MRLPKTSHLTFQAGVAGKQFLVLGAVLRWTMMMMIVVHPRRAPPAALAAAADQAVSALFKTFGVSVRVHLVLLMLSLLGTLNVRIRISPSLRSSVVGI